MVGLFVDYWSDYRSATSLVFKIFSPSLGAQSRERSPDQISFHTSFSLFCSDYRSAVLSNASTSFAVGGHPFA